MLTETTCYLWVLPQGQGLHNDSDWQMVALIRVIELSQKKALGWDPTDEDPDIQRLGQEALKLKEQAMTKVLGNKVGLSEKEKK